MLIDELGFLQRRVIDLEIENQKLVKRLAILAPDLSLILDRLLNVGLTEWADRATSNYNLLNPTMSDSLTPLIAKLYTAATLNNTQLVVQLFREILMKSQTPPTNEESIAMQSILNEVYFPVELISFNQWINI